MKPWLDYIRILIIFPLEFQLKDIYGISLSWVKVTKNDNTTRTFISGKSPQKTKNIDQFLIIL